MACGKPLTKNTNITTCTSLDQVQILGTAELGRERGAHSRGQSLFRVIVSLHLHKHPVRQQGRYCASCTNEEPKGESSWQTAQGHTGDKRQNEVFLCHDSSMYCFHYSNVCTLSWPQIVFFFFFFSELVGFKPTFDLPIPPVPRSGSEVMAKIFTCSFLLSEKKK